MNILPVDRALSIYGALANRSETKGARERLSKHLMKKYFEGERDEHRLTVHGLSFLQGLDREIDSRSPAVSARSFAGLFSPPRRERLQSGSVFASVVASCRPFRPLASSAELASTGCVLIGQRLVFGMVSNSLRPNLFNGCEAEPAALAVPMFSSPTPWLSNDFGGGQRRVDL
jgi:hypothetical protein